MILIFTAVGIVAALLFIGDDAVFAGGVLGFLLAKVLQLSEQVERLSLRLNNTEQQLKSMYAVQTPIATNSPTAAEHISIPEVLCRQAGRTAVYRGDLFSFSG
jgi:hypothetical protein